MSITQCLYLVGNQNNLNSFIHNSISGGASRGNYHYNSISEFDITTEGWKSYGTMMRRRAWFSLGLVDMSTHNYCTN